MIKEIGIETARYLIDYSGGDERLEAIGEEQLQGAVALHNILVNKKFAYLADEVGMGKTYTAIGVVALFKHFNPGFNVLYIAPRQNIQEKWLKEIKTFTKRNWKITDNIVKSFQGSAAYGINFCKNLNELLHQSIINPKKDFILRLTSFSLPLSNQKNSLIKKRDELLYEISWMDKRIFSIKDKEEFKLNYAKAINSILPKFDLIIIDEGHNLKHGIKSSAARNTVLAYSLGHPGGNDKNFPTYQKRFERVLFLSATPLENDYSQLWNQLELFDFGEDCSELSGNSSGIDEKQKEEIVGEFLIRRINKIPIAGNNYTKNMYRREWRQGGFSNHDYPLEVPDEEQKLVVGLIQKKVSEILNDEKFNNSFQIGMLSSFESFMQTSQARKKIDNAMLREDSDEELLSNFDNADQTNSILEKEGIDTNSIDIIADSYYRRFGQILPHPKMDQVVDHLKQSFITGKKQLVFVRRVASVYEITEKLNQQYDQWISLKITAKLPDKANEEFKQVFAIYKEERKKRIKGFRVEEGSILKNDDPFEQSEEQDAGEISNFFTWFFRGKGPSDYFSGASFNKNQFNSESSPFSTFFDENYISLLLSGEKSLGEIAKICALEEKEFVRKVKHLANCIFEQSRKRQEKYLLKRVYFSYQHAFIQLLALFSQDEKIKAKAQVILRNRFASFSPCTDIAISNFPNPDKYFRVQTFFTEIRNSIELSHLLPSYEDSDDIFENYFIQHEKKRELLSTVARLGHTMIELWLLAAKTLNTIKSHTQKRVEGRYKILLNDFIELLTQQKRNVVFGAYEELSQASHNLEILLANNFSEIKDNELSNLSKVYGSALSKQSPIRGMAGGVNKNYVRQFRMPGYPLILITTEVLQEGEDLHTFCSNIIHYGIAWNPSSMEQRTGRIDRINSLAHRELSKMDYVEPNEFIQVYYPHLKDTVELLQVERVFERMNRFIRMMHKSIKSENVVDSKTYINQDILANRKDIHQITEELKSAFPVLSKYLHQDKPVIDNQYEKISDHQLEYFYELRDQLTEEFRIEIHESNKGYSIFGNAYIVDSEKLLPKGHDIENTRIQPFELRLFPLPEYKRMLLQCRSPIGKVPYSDVKVLEKINNFSQRFTSGKICAVEDSKTYTYNLSVEGSIPFHISETKYEEVRSLIERTLITADLVEYQILNTDRSTKDISSEFIFGIMDEEN